MKLKSKTLLFILLLLFTSNIVLAQTDAQKAQIRVHITNANSALQSSNWDQALSNVNKAQDVLGSSAAIFESIRIKAYHGKKEYQKAKEYLLIFFQLNPADNLIDEIAPISLEIDNFLEEKRKKEAEQKRKEEERRRLAAEAERKAEAERQILNKKKAEIAKRIESEIETTLNKITLIKEGVPYFITYRKALTAASTEKVIMIHYGNRYIAYTIPNLNLAKQLYKDKVSYNSSMPTGINIAEVKSKQSRGTVRFQGSKKFSNVFFGGFSDDLLWTSGQQNTIFDKTVYYYYETTGNGTYPKLWMDVEVPKTFKKTILNPYIETGKIEKTVDYELIQNDSLKNRLQSMGFKNTKSNDLDNPEIAKVTLKTVDNGITILYPTKMITYQFQEKVKGVFNSNNQNYSGTFLHFTPQKINTHYGFMRVGISYPDYNLFSGINYTTEVSNYEMTATTFDSFYESINNPELEVGETRYFTSTNYRSIFEVIPALLGE